jgi:hypothetical protein
MMSICRDNTAALDDARPPVRAKLAAAWTSFMFLYSMGQRLGIAATLRQTLRSVE